MSSDTLATVLLIAGAYLLGALPSSYVLARFVKGIDIRKYGSGNVGISNFAVQAGWRWSVPLVLFDIYVKGLLPVLLASDKVLGLGLSVEVAAGFAAILGHNWSVWLKFGGGRGMATVLGVLATLYYPLVFAYGAVAGFGWLATRRKDSAVWWGVAALMLPVFAALLWVPGWVGIEVVVFCLAFLLITAIKRLTSNRSTEGGREKVPLGRLVWNRIVFDRDITLREDWVYRGPQS